MWCWYRQVTLTANAVYFLIAWPGGVREGRAAFATVSALPSQVFLIVKLFNVSEGSSLILQYIPLHPTDHASLLRLPTGIPGL